MTATTIFYMIFSRFEPFQATGKKSDIMKTKFRLAGRGGQGIKFAGSFLAKAAMKAQYHTTLTVDYTPSVRGGPIFCDIVISSEPISYPFCNHDANVLLMLDQEVTRRASEDVYQKTAKWVCHLTVKEENR